VIIATKVCLLVSILVPYPPYFTPIEKDNKPDTKPANEQPGNPEADYEYARKLQEMMDVNI
jgi:hypothetical protein